MSGLKLSPNLRLMSAVIDNRPEDVRRAVADGAEVNLRGAGGKTPLVFAAWFGRNEITEFLLEAGADANAKDNSGWTALRFAIQKMNVEIVGLLAKHTKDLEDPDSMGWTLLMHAAVTDPKITEILLLAGADKNAKDSSGMGAVEYSLISKHWECFEVLLRHKAGESDFSRLMDMQRKVDALFADGA